MLNAIGDDGKAVDWWFMYKVSSQSETPDDVKVNGTEYVYFDASQSKSAGSKLGYSLHKVSDKAGALYGTLSQLYGAGATNKSLGFFFYNDEVPGGKVNGSRGHTKGMLAFDLSTNTAVWLIVSTPKFPAQTAYQYPPTGEKMAQTLLCISLKDADAAQQIAKQMRVAHQPNVYKGKLPDGLDTADPRYQLIKNTVATGNTPVHSAVPFQSRAGEKFNSMAKNKYWGLDFYNDLVGPTLKEGLEVETWEHDPQPRNLEADKIHKIVTVASVDLHPLGQKISWANAFDHAKLAISDEKQEHDPTDTARYVCVGDINFTKAMEKRGGGTVAFLCPPLWTSLSEILETTPPTGAPKKAAAKKKPAKKPKK